MRALLALAAAAALAPPPFATPDALVTEFYRHVVERKPLGIPAGADRAALWPLMTPRLARILETAHACERDYLRQHPATDEKPEYGWLEYGLFSGGNEMALPAAVSVLETAPDGPGRFRVRVEFTYEDAPGDGEHPARPRSRIHWAGTALVDCTGGACLLDDAIPSDPRTGAALPAASRSFTGCDGGRWIGTE